jgi:heat-inducible transcriptional repressor
MAKSANKNVVDDMTLDDRKKMILESIIKDYVESAEPVGSRAVVKKHDLKISAATVRNEMADLEELGYLEQPHTSAGRIPSQQGYRFFVDCLMEKESLSSQDHEILERVLKDNSNEWSDVIEKVGNFLAHVTNYTSFIVVPSLDSSEFKSLQIIPIDTGKALLILVTDMGVIMHRKIDINEDIGEKDLKEIAGLFNRTLTHRRLGEMRRSDLQLLRDNLRRHQNVVASTLEALDLILGSVVDDKVVISGALNMLKEPEFKDIEKLNRIVNILEESDIKDFIPRESHGNLNIRIGNENIATDIQDMSLIYSGFKGFSDTGKIGIMGPIRMEYWKAVGAIEAAKEIIEQIIKRRFLG